MIKTQIIVDVEIHKIISTDHEKGSVHDFTLFKTTVRAIFFGILLLADSGDQGLLKLHKNSRIPYKKSKNHPLTAEQKSYNRELSKIASLLKTLMPKLKQTCSETQKQIRLFYQKSVYLGKQVDFWAVSEQV